MCGTEHPGPPTGFESDNDVVETSARAGYFSSDDPNWSPHGSKPVSRISLVSTVVLAH
jgi:hypothetical protein